ncbi:MAG: hypothetical protein ACLPYS_19345 [Vulcanimicrobiaceae bacterium]
MPSRPVEKASSARSCSPIAYASLWYQLPIAQTGAEAVTFIWYVLMKTGSAGPVTPCTTLASHCT